ncbi:MAG: hypothetical protein AAB590_00800 [Patescibacteria group bacterium]
MTLTYEAESEENARFVLSGHVPRPCKHKYDLLLLSFTDIDGRSFDMCMPIMYVSRQLRAMAVKEIARMGGPIKKKIIHQRSHVPKLNDGTEMILARALNLVSSLR